MARAHLPTSVEIYSMYVSKTIYMYRTDQDFFINEMRDGVFFNHVSHCVLVLGGCTHIALHCKKGRRNFGNSSLSHSLVIAKRLD